MKFFTCPTYEALASVHFQMLTESVSGRDLMPEQVSSIRRRRRLSISSWSKEHRIVPMSAWTLQGLHQILRLSCLFQAVWSHWSENQVIPCFHFPASPACPAEFSSKKDIDTLDFAGPRAIVNQFCQKQQDKSTYDKCNEPGQSSKLMIRGDVCQSSDNVCKNDILWTFDCSEQGNQHEFQLGRVLVCNHYKFPLYLPISGLSLSVKNYYWYFHLYEPYYN